MQLCSAYRSEGGVTIVVMTQKEKLDMEATFSRIIPEEARFGSKFVFRQVTISYLTSNFLFAYKIFFFILKYA